MSAGSIKRPIALLGATGYTGRLVAERLVANGVRPTLIGRSPEKLERVRDNLGTDVELRMARADDPVSLRAATANRGVLISTAGPFCHTGDAVVRAAVESGCHYLDSAGEPGFHAAVLRDHHHAAQRRGVSVLTGFGTEWILGNLAGALALEEHAHAERVEIGYFLRRDGRALGPLALSRSFAAASLASGIALLTQPGLRWRAGRLRVEGWARRLGTLDLRNRLLGLSTGGTEHFALPRLNSRLESVDVYLGWFGALSPLVWLGAPVAARLLRDRARADRAEAIFRRHLSTPGERLGAGGDTSSLTVARAHSRGEPKATQVVLRGGDLYSLTADFLAWGAIEAATRPPQSFGVVGPVEAFGLSAVTDAAQRFGIRVDAALQGEPGRLPT